MHTYRWIFIGSGKITDDFLKDLALATNARHQVAAVVSNTFEHAKKFAETFNIPYYGDDVPKALQEVQADIAYIATAHPFHFEEAMHCLKKGVHVLCEKPVALNEAMAAKMFAEAKRNNVFMMEAMWIRFLPSLQTVLKVIADGTIGQLQNINAVMNFKAPKDNDERYFNASLGGGSLLDLGVYGIYLSVLLLGAQPQKVLSYCKLSKTGVDEYCTATLSYSNGTYALLESSFIKQGLMPAYIYGEHGCIEIASAWLERTDKITVQVYGEAKPQVYNIGWEGHGFQFQVEEVVKCIENGALESQHLPHAHSLAVMQIADTIRRQNGIVYRDFETPASTQQNTIVDVTV
jgi:predicted dehydrogenase